jgi:PAS domain S-box-containing protein
MAATVLVLLLAVGAALVGGMAVVRQRSAREHWHTLFDSSPIPTYAYDLDSLALVAVNQTLCERYGYAADELMGQSVTRLHVAAEWDELRTVVAALRTSQDPQFRRRWVQCKRSGEEVPVEIFSRPLRRLGAHIRVVVAVDISEKLRAEQALASQQRFQDSLLETLPVPVFYKDRAGRYLGVNAAFVQLMGRPREFFVGKSVWDIAPAATAQVYHDADEALFSQPESVQVYDAHVLSGTQGRREVVFTKSVFYDHRGALGGLVGVVMDVTAQRASEQAVRESESRMAQILHHSPLPVFVIDAQHRVLVWNPACEYTFGVRASAVLGSTRHWSAFYASERPCMADIVLDGGSQLDIERYYHGRYRRSTLNPEAFEAEDFFPHLGESGRWLQFTAAPLRDSTGQVVGAIETLIDISALKRAQQEVQQFNAELEDKVRARTAELALANENLRQASQQLVQSEKLAALGHVVAGVAHELNTPVGIVLTAATALQHHARTLQAEIQGGSGLRRASLNDFIARSIEACDLMERNAQRAAKLVGNFKEVAVNRASMLRRRFALHTVVDEVHATLHGALQSQACTLETAIAADIVLDSYPGALGQILSHLVMNTLQHGLEGRTQGHIRLQAQVHAHTVDLRFADDGTGMDAQARHRAFDPFYTTKLGQGGSGLGLYIVYNLATGILGGSVALHSEEGAGVCIVLTLPLAAPDNAADLTSSSGFL